MSFKAPTLRDQGAYGVQPHEVAFAPQAPVSQPVSKIKAIKAARDAVERGGFGNRLGLKDAKDAVEAVFQSIEDQGFKLVDSPVGDDEVVLSDAETKAARKALTQVHANADVKLAAVLAAINNIRNNDPVGTLRKNSKGQYAFSYEPGKWLLIDVDKPAYRAEESPAQNAAIQGSWALIAKG
ncbi:hypothetical protein SEA_DUNCANSLEG_88 [Mycobacterium phage DuncansLeg]|nr:hypothetical protein SEA_DUNCANSLEG_88 [Mycobacterium phage DuncansLeg]